MIMRPSASYLPDFWRFLLRFVPEGSATPAAPPPPPLAPLPPPPPRAPRAERGEGCPARQRRRRRRREVEAVGAAPHREKRGFVFGVHAVFRFVFPAFANVTVGVGVVVGVLGVEMGLRESAAPTRELVARRRRARLRRRLRLRRLRRRSPFFEVRVAAQRRRRGVPSRKGHAFWSLLGPRFSRREIVDDGSRVFRCRVVGCAGSVDDGFVFVCARVAPRRRGRVLFRKAVGGFTRGKAKHLR